MLYIEPLSIELQLSKTCSQPRSADSGRKVQSKLQYTASTTFLKPQPTLEASADSAINLQPLPAYSGRKLKQLLATYSCCPHLQNLPEPGVIATICRFCQKAAAWTSTYNFCQQPTAAASAWRVWYKAAAKISTYRLCQQAAALMSTYPSICLSHSCSLIIIMIMMETCMLYYPGLEGSPESFQVCRSDVGTAVFSQPPLHLHCSCTDWTWIETVIYRIIILLLLFFIRDVYFPNIVSQ